MDRQTIRTSLDIPVSLHRKLHEAALRQGCSARQLILRGIETVVHQTPTQPKRRVRFPLIRSKNRLRTGVTNEMIYDMHMHVL